ncbi:hypothetical protein [Winogradskyella sp.]|uniref:hypothetical protein n=1 Tax=Winogradskyella sp. TaxID=1883156 RepID=UPI003AB4DB7C
MKKLKAGSLQLVTFIVVVVALLLSAFIILIHIHKQFRIKSNHIIETVGLVDKGIGYVLLSEDNRKDTISILLFDEDYKSVKAHKSFWGTFEKVYAKAKIKNTILEKTALVGARRDRRDLSVLYLKDNNKPLVLVGNTRIEGNAYLPKRRVKTGNISGTSYFGEKYIYGNMAVCKSFPKIDQEVLDHIKVIDKGHETNFEKVEYIDLKRSKRHANSFENPLQLIYSNSDILLSDISITGHIRVQSETKIIVDASAKLTDVILIAPVIGIQKQVKGAFQAFATKSIDVGERVVLDYPSALVLKKDYVKEVSNKSNMIFVADHSIINGNILALGKTLPKNYDAQIKINPNAIIKGVVYCAQNLELRGTVYGAVYTNNFIIKEKGSIYQNHLFNAIISDRELQQGFMGLPIENAKNGIAKWLY